MSSGSLIGLGITAVVIAVAAASGPLNQPYFLLQLAIPRGDGTEIVAVARAGYWSVNNMPEPGWTVPVYYRERLGSTTLVEIMGPPSRAGKAHPPA